MQELAGIPDVHPRSAGERAAVVDGVLPVGLLPLLRLDHPLLLIEAFATVAAARAGKGPDRTGPILGAAIGLAVALALAGCSGSAPGSGTLAATSIVSVSPLDTDGRIRADWKVKQDPPPDDLTALALDCWGPSDWALGPNIQSCGATADDAAVCWAPPGQDQLYCGLNPWTPEVRELRSAQLLTAVPASANPSPWGVELADGNRCGARTGGTWFVGPDGTVPMYACEHNDVYLMQPAESAQTIDRSHATWTALAWRLPEGTAFKDYGALPPPATIAVKTAYFAG